MNVLKYTTAYYLLLLYMTVIVKPVLPILSDWYQHEFNKVEHLVCVHSIYGSEHLQHEIADINSNDHHGKNQSTLKIQDQVPFHVVINMFKNEYNSLLSALQFGITKCIRPSFVVITTDDPPPKFV